MIEAFSTICPLTHSGPRQGALEASRCPRRVPHQLSGRWRERRTGSRQESCAWSSLPGLFHHHPLPATVRMTAVHAPRAVSWTACRDSGLVGSRLEKPQMGPCAVRRGVAPWCGSQVVYHSASVLWSRSWPLGYPCHGALRLDVERGPPRDPVPEIHGPLAGTGGACLEDASGSLHPTQRKMAPQQPHPRFGTLQEGHLLHPHSSLRGTGASAVHCVFRASVRPVLPQTVMMGLQQGSGIVRGLQWGLEVSHLLV